MDYKILYQGTFPIIEARMQQGEFLKAESDAMVSMSPTIDLEGKMEGGFLKGLGRMLSGEKFFFQTLYARRGPGTVLLATAAPGGIQDVQLDGSYGLCVQKDGFLAATHGIEVSTQMQNLLKGLFSQEGFFILKISGKGLVFLSSYGAIHSINLEAGEEIIIDNGHLVAWPDYMEYRMEKAASGWISSITSGEGIVCRFRGPGTILIQTRNPKGFGSWVRQFMPSGR
ncbi:MAG TPA: TIGR00266 family protein [Pseudobacteroides sp.]|nr:TIGR00266 family protein [Pseudobacteroides sp.]